MALQIRGIHHIVLNVSDPKRLAMFYQKILGVKADFVTDNVICIPCSSFRLCLQLPPRQDLVNDRFDENRIGLDHIGFSVASRQQLNELLTTLQALNIPTVGIEYDPDGKSTTFVSEILIIFRLNFIWATITMERNSVSALIRLICSVSQEFLAPYLPSY